MQHVAVMACVSLVSEDIGKLPLRVMRRLPNGGKEPVKGHYLAPLLRKPNDYQNRFEFVEMMQSAVELRGNAYAVILRNGRGYPEQLIPIHPDRVTLYEAPGGEWFFLVTRQGLHEMAVLRGVGLMIPAEDVFHLRWLSMWNALLGTSRIGLMREAVGLGMSLEQHQARLMGQGARPGGVLMTDKKLTAEVIGRLKDNWKDTYEGYQNSGKTAILEEGLKWEALTMSNADAQFMDNRRFQLEDICRGFRVPRHKLGLPVEGAESGLVQYEQAYLNDTLSPRCERWVPKIEELGGLDGEDMFVEFDYEHFLKADIKTRIEAKRAGLSVGLYTINEARRAEGLPDVEHGDVPYVPANMVPLGTPPKPPGSAGAGGVGSDTTGQPAPGGAAEPEGAPPGDQPADNE
jgi:HK97 family phage portal protein